MAEPNRPAAPSRAELLAALEAGLGHPVLPHAEERRRRTREALARGDAFLRESPIGRGEW